MHAEQGVAVTGRDVTVLAHRAVSAARPPTPTRARRPARQQRYRQRQRTPTGDRRQRAKQHWPIGRASNKRIKLRNANFNHGNE